MPRVRILVAALAGVILACTIPAWGACIVYPREHVVLFGVGDDSGVFLWDSRFRLKAYHAASFDEAEALLPHALLLNGGTRALVIRCYHNDVQPKYSLTPDDAIYVIIVSGPQRGHSGWVLGGDVRVLLSQSRVH